MTALVENIDFRCNAAVCYGVGPRHDQFRALQATINRSADAVGFTRLRLDGLLGPLTVANANLVAQANNLQSPGATSQELAVNALDFTTQLSALAAAALVPSSVATVDIPSSVPPPEISASAQQLAETCRTNPKAPSCQRARILCRRLQGDPVSLAAARPLCEAIETRPQRLRLLLGASILLASVGVGAAITWRTRRG